MISLRKAMPGEIAALWDLRTRAVAHGCAGHYTPEVLGVWLAAPAPASLADRIALGQAMAAVEDGALLGYAVLDTREGEVDAVFVDPDAQGRGVGLSLLASVEAAARTTGLTRLFLSASLNAVPFYRCAGFIAVREELYPHRSGIGIPSVYMEKQLS
ncbi:GNAT family N-acetyltransferase [Massilia sp. Se16.2.3]|uniref:GNAT family N-acetyltransferase n=1 Tax=Massilia sp. Se16.2.3 TaxID=2709303 RepID=UPI001601FA65|nr:GNAT family N-acetyltransferase [Massilia sp. Se16.2.3]QNA99027.1 GNAT family N-acetyltransferase [Massilia sp. Se16.2.3]